MQRADNRIGGTRAMLLGVQSMSFGGADITGMTPINFVYEILQSLVLPDAAFIAAVNHPTLLCLRNSVMAEPTRPLPAPFAIETLITTRRHELGQLALM